MFRLFTRFSPVQRQLSQTVQNLKFSTYPRTQFRHSEILRAGNAKKSPGAILKELGKAKTGKHVTKTEFFDTSLSPDVAKNTLGNVAKAIKSRQAAGTNYFDMSLPKGISAPEKGSVQRAQLESRIIKELKRITEVNKTNGSTKVGFFDKSVSEEVVTPKPKAEKKPKAQQKPTVSKKLEKSTDKDVKKTELLDMSLSTETAAAPKKSGKKSNKDKQALPQEAAEESVGKNKEPVCVKAKNNKAFPSRDRTPRPSDLAKVNLEPLFGTTQDIDTPDIDTPDLGTPDLSIISAQTSTPAEFAIIPKKKKKSKKAGRIPKDHFHDRLRQILLYYYSRLQTSTLPASLEVKQFLATTPFSTAYRLIAAAVLPATKCLINTGSTGHITNYGKLQKDCLVPNQGCYMNVITQPNGSFGVYIGGASSLSGKCRSVKRALRGRPTDPPFAETRSCGGAGVGRRVAQHLAEIEKKSVRTAHYRCIQEKGSRYDFRLLAAFQEPVDTGAVWVLESFLVLELGTMPAKGGLGLARYKGLNRRDPLTTSVTLSSKVVTAGVGKTKVELPAVQTAIDAVILSSVTEGGEGARTCV
ncbi:hypothetical protein P167DRAFT_606935 [Morchella conica CCBAS932]|uniref:Uncharacterized protein n=1 Tax=Morchella conica CCBAS932 TaxID=1392247 RepID=A0A3N4KQX6_9PEZI|nr:hypothetical protein P167DRAFT_606935 [Morchella conica CCBAS932]